MIVISGPNAAQSLAAFVGSPDCPLERLILGRSDINDFVCSKFFTLLESNVRLKDLDLGTFHLFYHCSVGTPYLCQR
jgi:hypothetical protein